MTRYETSPRHDHDEISLPASETGVSQGSRRSGRPIDLLAESGGFEASSGHSSGSLHYHERNGFAAQLKRVAVISYPYGSGLLLLLLFELPLFGTSS